MWRLAVIITDMLSLLVLCNARPDHVVEWTTHHNDGKEDIVWMAHARCVTHPIRYGAVNVAAMIKGAMSADVRIELFNRSNYGPGDRCTHCQWGVVHDPED